MLLVNSEKTHDIINNFFQESDIDIVKNLSNKTHLKTEYIEKRLKVRKSNELKLLYLENLSKEKEIKKVINYF